MFSRAALRAFSSDENAPTNQNSTNAGKKPTKKRKRSSNQENSQSFYEPLDSPPSFSFNDSNDNDSTKNDGESGDGGGDMSIETDDGTMYFTPEQLNAQTDEMIPKPVVDPDFGTTSFRPDVDEDNVTLDLWLTLTPEQQKEKREEWNEMIKNRPNLPQIYAPWNRWNPYVSRAIFDDVKDGGDLHSRWENFEKKYLDCVSGELTPTISAVAFKLYNAWIEIFPNFPIFRPYPIIHYLRTNYADKFCKLDLQETRRQIFNVLKKKSVTEHGINTQALKLLWTMTHEWLQEYSASSGITRNTKKAKV